MSWSALTPTPAPGPWSPEPLHALFVPTVHTAARSHLLRVLLAQHHHVLLLGPTATAKSLELSAELRALSAGGGGGELQGPY